MKKQKVMEAVTGDDGTLDRISDLPDSLLVRILSLSCRRRRMLAERVLSPNGGSISGLLLITSLFFQDLCIVKMKTLYPL